MTRNAIRNLVVLALVVALAPSDLVLGQGFPGGGGGFGRGRRFNRGFPGMIPVPVPVQPEQPKQEEKKEEKKDEKPKLPEGPPPVTRPAAVENPAQLETQKMRIDDKKQVSFNFQEAPWPFVLEEVARVSGMELNWNTLPGDSLNLRSNGKYPIGQARDAINAQLLSRGYSMVVDPKALTITVLNLDNMSTALVPRAAPEDLEN